MRTRRSLLVVACILVPFALAGCSAVASDPPSVAPTEVAPNAPATDGSVSPQSPEAGRAAWDACRTTVLADYPSKVAGIDQVVRIYHDDQTVAVGADTVEVTVEIGRNSSSATQSRFVCTVDGLPSAPHVAAVAEKR